MKQHTSAEWKLVMMKLAEATERGELVWQVRYTAAETPRAWCHAHGCVVEFGPGRDGKPLIWLREQKQGDQAIRWSMPVTDGRLVAAIDRQQEASGDYAFIEEFASKVLLDERPA